MLQVDAASTRSTTSSRSTSGRTTRPRTACSGSSSTSTASTVVGIAAVIGYLHTGFEKTMEQKTWWKCITYPERIDYVSFQYNELVFVLAIEKLLEIEVPRKATWMRMCLGELTRIHSHLVWLGTSALELGAISMFWYCVPRARRDPRPLRDGRRHADAHALLPGRRARRGHPARASTTQAREFCEQMPKAIDEYETILDRNAIWLERTKGVGLLSADDAIALGQSGPVLRASGVDWDLRKRMPYLAYDEVDFDVPVYHGRRRLRPLQGAHGRDARSRCGSSRSASTGSRRCEGEPWIADDRKVVLPPREELHTSMESLIHHFKIVTEGYRVPEGEVYIGDRVAARRVRAATSSRTAARSRGASSSARRASSRCRRPRPA